MTDKPAIEAVYEHYDLRITGADRSGWRKAQCPLPDHDDANPSASVNADEQSFYCHACGEGGDSYTIIMRRNGVGFAAAVRLAKEIAGDGDSGVRGTTRRDNSLVPARKRHRPGRGNWTPPWKMRGSDARA